MCWWLALVCLASLMSEASLTHLHILFLFLFFFVEGNLVGGQQDVVPSEELLGIGGVDALAVVVGQHGLEQAEEFLTLGFLGLESGRFAVKMLIYSLQYIFQGTLVAFSEDAYLAQRADAVVFEDGVFLTRYKVLNNGAAFGLRYQFA